MHDYINAEESELWNIILDRPWIPTKEVKDKDLTTIVVKTKKSTMRLIERRLTINTKQNIMVYGIGADEYNIITM